MTNRPYRLTRAMLAVALLAIGAPVVAQTTVIRGHVVDASTDLPLPGVNVFIANTTVGGATGNDGSFRIDGPTNGVIELVASMVGYEPLTNAVVLTSRTDEIVVDFRMHERIFNAGEAVVSARRPRDWKRNLERFTRELIGTSQNADSTTILNPYVLDFVDDPEAGTLQAFASEPLRIENRALGYDVVFVLEDFLVTDHPYSIRYRGSPRFSPRHPSSEEERRTLEERRRTAYLGSFRHFLVSLTSSSLDAEGFDVRAGKQIETRQDMISLLPRVEDDSLMARGVYPFERQIYAPGVLHVFYREEPESGKYRRFVREVSGHARIRRHAQASYLEFDRGVTMHTTGYLYDPYSVTTRGYWAWERIGDALPRDYRPQEVTASSE